MRPLIVEEARRRFGAGLVIKSLSQVALEEEEVEQALLLSSVVHSHYNQEEVGAGDIEQAMSLSAIQEQRRIKTEEQLEDEITEAIAR